MNVPILIKKNRSDIFIPTSNRADSLKKCLLSLNKQSNKQFRVIVIGIKKSRNIESLIKKHAKCDIVYKIQKNKGLINAANEALNISKNEFFIRIDDDVVLSKNWHKEILKTFDSDKKIGGVTGPTIMSTKGIESRDLTKFISKFSAANNILDKFFKYIYLNFLYENKYDEVTRFLPSGVFTLGSNLRSSLNIKNLKEVDSLEACNWSVRTKLLKKIGGFDRIYLKGLGDYHESDAALKIKSLGYKLIFNPKVRLNHNVEISKVPRARPASFYRIQNLFIFYFRFFRIRSFGQILKFAINIMMQNGYYLFRFVSTGKFNQLGSVVGTPIGLIRGLLMRPKYKIL